MDKRVQLIGLLLIVLGSRLATATEMPKLPDACDPRESPSVCYLQIQRSDALDHLAVAQGDLFGTKVIDAKRAEYWRNYMSGVPNLELLNLHLRTVCAWRGGMNKPTADMCDWWHRVTGGMGR